MELEPCNSTSPIYFIKATPFLVTFSVYVAPAVSLGALSFLTFLAVIFLYRNGFRERANVAMLVIIVTMYIVSLTHFAVMMHQSFAVGEVQMGTRTSQKWLNFPVIQKWMADAEGSTVLFNVILSDAIVMWRAWVIWDKSKTVLAISSIFSLATAAIGIWSVKGNGGIASSNQGIGVLPPSSAVGVLNTLVLCALSLSSNLWATTLVAWKAWIHRRWFKQLPENGGARASVVGRTLFLLLESGAVYSLFWIFLIVTFESPADSKLARASSIFSEIIVYVSRSAFKEKTGNRSPQRPCLTIPRSGKSLAEMLEGMS
ncbi:hypothetical protein BC834DRAFT_633397 [Gloeopeniophorella convolvens]|nr:hypothetical protein BC834DRAFT_633397 [Gloeopeniophorella convolvens]